MATKYKKGDFVIVDESGKPTRYEIISPLSSSVKGGRRSSLSAEEVFYEARNTSTKKSRTVSEDEILRMATPVDDSSELFEGR